MKKVIMVTKIVDNGYVFEEAYKVANHINADKYANDMIDNFNNTLRPNESRRELIGVREEPAD